MKELLSRAAALAACLALVSINVSHSEPFRSGDREFALLVGYGENHRIPTSMKARLRFGDTTLRWGRFVSDRNENAFEIVLSSEFTGEDNQAAMAVVSRRHYFMTRHNTALGYDLGFGVMRFENVVEGLATRANFTEQVGLVLQHKIGSSSAVSIQYRFCHISNGGIKNPNVGVNASTLSIGWSWFM